LKALHLVLGLVLISAAASAGARDTHHMYPVSDALATSGAQEKLDAKIKLYFGDQPHAKALKTMGEFTTNKKTNAFGKADKTACEWAFLDAMLSLQERARSEGANAVINIKSYYKKDETSSSSEYMCGAGALMAGVTFKGTMAKLAN
jgi:uncharacterized protein YjbJ (UPF0337 family)